MDDEFRLKLATLRAEAHQISSKWDKWDHPLGRVAVSEEDGATTCRKRRPSTVAAG